MQTTGQDAMIMPTASSYSAPTRLAAGRSASAMSTEEIKARIEAMFAARDVNHSPALVD
ncbi:hypothetical protein ACH47B_05345 [Rhodococcus sp. NPDC019627]|uniref:hypothetical protein n=1 Tax=unclassified Rhodococcus (in: high G+C Gram-positive bacteria) TaxID=192944 RepID=UPI0033E70B7D